MNRDAALRALQKFAEVKASQSKKLIAEDIPELLDYQDDYDENNAMDSAEEENDLVVIDAVTLEPNSYSNFLEPLIVKGVKGYLYIIVTNNNVS
jgi:hypothetical protein